MWKGRYSAGQGEEQQEQWFLKVTYHEPPLPDAQFSVPLCTQALLPNLVHLGLQEVLCLSEGGDDQGGEDGRHLGGA